MEAARVAILGEALSRGWGYPQRSEGEGGLLGLCQRRGVVALVEMDKLRPRLRDEAVEAVWEGFVQIATDHGPAEIRGLRDKLIATHGHEGEVQRRQDQLKHGVVPVPAV